MPGTTTLKRPFPEALHRHQRVNGPIQKWKCQRFIYFVVRSKEWWTNVVLKTRRVGFGILE